MTMLRGDGTSFPAEVSSVIYRSDEGEQQAYVIFRDISERRRADAEQRVATENIRSVIDNSPLAVVGIDTDGTVVIWNQAATHLFGWSTSEAMGGPNPIGVSQHEPQLIWLRNRALAGETLTGVELVRERKDGSQIEVSVSTTAIRAFDGRIVCVLALFEDISVRKTAERSRIASKHVDALQKLALGMRHYMNNTIAAISLELELLLLAAPLSSEARQGISSATEHVARLAAIVRRLDRVEELDTVPYLGDTMMIDVSPDGTGSETDERS
jgi:PAS domain S-box-containing protein